MFYNLTIACISPLKWNKTTVISIVWTKSIDMNMLILPSSHHPRLVINYMHYDQKNLKLVAH